MKKLLEKLTKILTKKIGKSRLIWVDGWGSIEADGLIIVKWRK